MKITEFIIESNNCVKQLEENGYHCHGRTFTDNFKSVAVLKDDNYLFFENYIQAKKVLLNNPQLSLF